MIRNILVCTDGSRHGDIACEYAIDLTHHLKARLTGLHVLDSRLLEGPLMADISGWIGAQPYGSQLQQFRDVLESKGEAVVTAFNDRCAKAGIAADCKLSMGHPSRIILDEENQSELVILGQRGLHADIIGDAMGSTVERVVRHSDKPCMVTASRYEPIRKILAAFDGSAHASDALREAVDLAKALKVELIIITVAEDHDYDQAGETNQAGLRLARSHDYDAVGLVAEGRRSAPAILETAQEQECDLVVAGAYGHSRIREMILGSTTMHLITHSEIPVMLVR